MWNVGWPGPGTARRARLVRAALAVALLGAAMPGLLVRAPSARAAADPVIVAVGDIACDPASSGFNNGWGTTTDCRHKWTADLLSSTGPVGPVDAVLPLGDEQYGCGGLSAFRQVYDPTWGVHNDKARPVPGNHEYQTTGGTGCTTQHDASGYFSYFGAQAGDPAKGYYSFDLGAWHIIAMNSELCYDPAAVGGTLSTRCPDGSPQVTWLKNDLAANPGVCTLAYWHEPRFSSTAGRGDYTVDPLWQALSAAKVDVLLTAHQHFYERLAPVNASGQADPNGVRQFIVGTGGESLMPLSTRLPTSQASNDETFGVLKMTLRSGSYDWQFVPIAGSTFTDSGSTACHPLQPDQAAPTTTIACDGTACSGDWYGTKPVSVSLSAGDSGSGVARTTYTTDGSDPATSATAVTYTGPFDLAATATVRFFSTDRAGNAEAPRSQLLKVDTVAPATAIACQDAACQDVYPGPVTVSLAATDAGGSGVAQTRYTVDGTDPATSATALLYGGPFAVTATSTVSYVSIDRAGNAEATRSQPIQIGSPPDDTTPPTTSIACNGSACADGWYGRTPVTVTLSATDSGSGVAETRYTVDGTDPVTSSTAISYAGAFGVADSTTVRFASIDNAGHAETARSALIRIDVTAPATTVSCNDAPCSDDWYRTAVGVSLSVADPGGSGPATTFYTTDGSDPAASPTAQVYTGPFPVTSTTTVKFSSTDAAGNVEATRSWTARIDTLVPSTPIACDGEPCDSGAYAGPVTVTLPAMDAGGSGLDRTVYTTDGTDPGTSTSAMTYSDPFTVTRTTTVRAFSVDRAGNVEPTGTQLIQVGAAGGTTGSVTLTPVEDSYSAKANPSSTHGSEGSIIVNSGAERRGYLKFAVTGIPADAIGITAVLRLYSPSGAPSSVTFTLSQAPTTWREATLAWNNQPALGATVTTRTGLAGGVYNAFDVSSLVNRDGSHAMVITSNNSTQRYLSSKESAPWRPPQLALSWTVPPVS